MTPEQAKTLADEFLLAGRPCGKYGDDFEHFWDYTTGVPIVRHPRSPDDWMAWRPGDIDEDATIANLPAFLREWADALEKK